MKIARLQLRGLLRFTAEVALTLRDLPDGLIAIVGENGAGKSTLLEAPLAALYRSFASRGDLINYATDRDAFVEAEIETAQGRFTARVNVNAATRASDAVLTRHDADGDVLLNDGKLRTFDAAVARIFPAKTQLLASAFAAQNKAGAFITLDKRQRKDLFTALLGLDRYAAMAETAAAAVQHIQTARVTTTTAIQYAAPFAAPAMAGALEREADALQVEIGQAEIAHTTLERRIAARTLELTAVAEAARQYVTTQEHLRAIDRDLAVHRAAAERVLADLARNVTEATRERAAAEATYTADQHKVDEAIANNQRLLHARETVDDAVLKVAGAMAAIETLRRAETAARTELVAARARLRELVPVHEDLRAIPHQITEADAALGMCAQVPCGGVPPYEACQFLRVAAAARVQRPVLAAKLPALRQAEADLTATQARIDEADTRVEGHRRQAEAEHATIRMHQPTANLIEKLNAATERIAELRRDTVRLATRRLEQVTDIDARLAARRQELTVTHQTELDTIDVLIADQTWATDQLAGLSEAHRQMEALTAAQDADRAAWPDSVARRARLEVTQTDLARRREDYARAVKRLTVLDGQLAALDDELVDWQLLAKACSRDGLPTHEIDLAGPTISAYTNDLLTVCYGPRFTVDLVTQQPKADGAGVKEAFTIAVYDNQRGGAPRDIADLSGGEQVLVAEALANAIGIFVNQRAPHPVQTCWRDETTGALDPENAGRYLEMLRRVRALGGYAQLLFITHNRSLAAQADAQLVVADGQVTTALPPYEAAL